MFDRITSEPDKMGGTPCIRRLRIRAANAVRRLQQTSRDKGLDQMTDAEIDEEIQAVRRQTP